MKRRDTVTIERLRNGLKVAAQCAMLDPVYRPIFERLEHEIATFKDRETFLDRARRAAGNFPDMRAGFEP